MMMMMMTPLQLQHQRRLATTELQQQRRQRPGAVEQQEQLRDQLRLQPQQPVAAQLLLPQHQHRQPLQQQLVARTQLR